MEKRKRKAKFRKKNERRADLQIIRTNVTQQDMYVWAICLCSMFVVLTLFIVVGLKN